MYRRLPWLGALFFTIVLAAHTQQPAPPKTHLKAGPPDFTLTDTEGKEVKLSDF
ncbi:hypothetical protein BH20ACI3_BH20ACI3_13500 [soil metagenome]